MAWQLIYTSAPRLLEAGRTGFGTVARHRAVGGLLAAAVERISQFARLAGLGPRRVIYSHRIITVGAGQFHVLSCVRDAGSDYTGRTNHLAHHLIADVREVAALAQTGVTPADVLLQMKWRTTWAEQPRFLEPPEEVPLAGMRSRFIASAWERATGRPENARLLSSQSAARFFVVVGAEMDALMLFQESLSGGPGLPWQTTFTTSLEPTDDAADFRWIAVQSSSPLRQQVDGGLRTVLDLTQPQTLPKVEAPGAPAAGARTSRESLPAAAPSTWGARPGQQEPADVPPQAWQPPGTPPAAMYESSIMEPLESAVRRPQKVRGWLIALTALFLIGAGTGAHFWLSSQAEPGPAAAAGQEAARVDEIWKRHRLLLPATASWLKQKADPLLTTSHEEALKVMEAALREPGAPVQLPRPETTQDEFMDLLDSFTRWHEALHEAGPGSTWEEKPPLEMRVEARAAVEKVDRQWKKLARHFSPPPRNGVDLRTDLHDRALRRLRQGRPEGGAREWRDLVSELSTDGLAPDWLDGWVKIVELPPHPAPLGAGDQELLAGYAGEASAPAWFHALAADRLSQARKLAQAEKEAVMSATRVAEPKEPEAKIEPADSPAARHPVFIALETPGTSLGRTLELLPPLPVQEDMQLLAGGAGRAEKQLLPWRRLGGAGVYRRSFTESDTIVFKDGRVTSVPEAGGGWRILGRTADGARLLFELILVPATDGPASVLSLDTVPAFKVESQAERRTLGKDASEWFQRLHFAGGQPFLRLQNLAAPATRLRILPGKDGALLEAEKPAAATPAAAARVSALNAEKQNLRKGIEGIEKEGEALRASNRTQREKEEGERRNNNLISGKEMQILQIEEELKTLTSPAPGAPPAGSVPAGRWALDAVTVSATGVEQARRLCEVEVQSQAPSQTAPPEPTQRNP